MSNHTFITIEAHQLHDVTGGITREEAVGHGEKIGGALGAAAGLFGGPIGSIGGGLAGMYAGGKFAGDMYDGDAMIPTGSQTGYYDQKRGY